MVLSQDESEAHSVRVVAINSDFKVILDELFTPCHEAVQHLENASHTLSLADIQVLFPLYIYIYLYLYHGFNCHSAESISFGRRNCLTYFLWILSWSVTLSNWTYKVKKTTP